MTRGLGRMMVGGRARSAVQKNPFEFYPTPWEATVALLQAEGVRWRELRAPIWEPCAGDGAISGRLVAAGLDVIACDIRPRAAGIERADFFSVSERRSPVIVTNPPFSRADEVVRRACELRVRYLALLLKATFFHAAGQIALWRQWKPARIYPLTWRLDFEGLGRPVMECAWFIWDGARRADPSYRPLARPL